jgi:hypothetical protein
VSRTRTDQINHPASYVPRDGEFLVIEFASTPIEFQSNR